MDWLRPIAQVLLWLCGHLSPQIGYIIDLDDNMDTLNQETERLKSKHDEVKAKVDDAVSSGKTQLPPVQTWLAAADTAVADVGTIRLEVEQMGNRCCCVDLNSRRRLGKRVIKKMTDIEKLSREGDFDRVAQSPRRSQMPDQKQVPEEIQRQSTSKETLEEIVESLNNEECGVISVWGMGGIGKTTLVKEIYNRFNDSTDFQQVIWVTVSKDLNLEVVQQKIGNKLGVKFHGNEGIEEKRDKLYRRLRNLKKYMLILDDLWEEFSLDDVGIPQPDRQNRCKIVITTRSKFVSNGMEADREIKVRALASDEAWNLFRAKTGDVILSPEIKPLAKNVVAECGGLPLAIITVGGAMRNKSKKELWEDALRALRAPAAPEVPGMEPKVFRQLKLSYDKLEDPKIRLFFLYCSLYPEDSDIHIEEHLVRYWPFEEGLIDNVECLDQAFKKGYGIIERLKDACLFEEGSQGDGYVRMHDLLRDLAIWITSPSSPSSSSPSPSSLFLVKAGERLVLPPEEKAWEGMERISLMHNRITELQMTPNCPDLVYLSLYKNVRLRRIHNNFFQLMPKLQILVLRETNIKSLPPSLSQLVNLRVLDASHCSHLQEVPPLGHLKELQRLDLCGTGIKSLPQCIASLAKLRSLDLSETKALATIPGDIISGLTSLEDLGLYSREQMMSMEIWREVATLPRLTYLRIMLPSLDAFSANEMKHPIWSRLSRFQVKFGDTNPSFGSRDYRARTLVISNCEELPSLQKAFGGGPPTGFQQVKSISIYGCHILRCIFSSIMVQHLQALESLSVSYCREIVEIVEGGLLPDTVTLSKLKSISIYGCHKLRCIFSSSMLQHMQALESLSVSYCREIVEIVEGGPLPDTVTLSKLKSISIYDCDKLRCIFSSGMLQHLQSLESLEVCNCKEIVEIVEGGPLPDTVTLPKLKGISISSCDKLRCIFSSSMLQHLQSLESLSVKKCEEIVGIVEGGLLPDTVTSRKLKGIRISGCHKLRCIFSSSMLQHLQSLESLEVKKCEEIVEIVEGGLLSSTVTLRKLKSIDISGCHKLRCIFSSGMFQHLQSLESLYVEDSEEIVEIVKGGPLRDMVTLRKLKSIRISGCDKLRCIFSSSMLQHLQSLESLYVYSCEEIVEIVEGGPLPDTVTLQKLKRIYIFGCHKLKCIFSSGMLQHLQSLESLEVYYCKEIVEIVEGGPLPDMALQRLSSMDLRKLPKLTAICSQQLVLTSMKEIQIYDCPELKKLPVLCSGIQEIRKGQIIGAREWWEGIEWGDEHSKSLYSTIYEETEKLMRSSDRKGILGKSEKIL